MDVRRWFHAGQGLALALLVGLAFLRIADPPLVESLRHKVFDAYQAASPRVWQPLPIAVIDIDERSLTQYGQWPWPRTVLAELVAKLSAAGTVAVAFDIVFAEPDRLSPQALAQSIRALPEAARVELSTLPDNDQVFGNAIRRSRVVLGQTGVNAETPRPPGLPVATIGGDPTRFLIQFPGLLLNQPALEDAASGRGLFSILPDPDGIVRRVPLAASAAGSIRSSLSVELLRVATGQDAFAIRSDEAGVSSIVVAGVQVPTDRNAHLWIAYTPHEPRRFVSAADVLGGTLPPGRLQNHLVVVGTSAVGLLDIRATPLNRTVPGVEIHVQALENMLTRSWLTRPHYALGAELVAMLVISLLIILLAPRLGALPIAGLGALTAVGLVGASWWLYQSQRTLVDVVYPLGTAFATFLVIAFDNFRREELQRRQVRSAFSRYLAPSVVEALARHPEQLRLGGETRELTIIFSDVRGFTTLSEGYRDNPEALTTLMNRLLSPLSDAIIERGGTIDKYMGDGIMAFWNAPLDVPEHAKRAVEAALDMLDRLRAFDATLAEENRHTGRAHYPLRLGIGVNTGSCVVGNLGSNLRFDYSALGDAVNLTSRLEGQSKAYAVEIIVSQATAAQLNDAFPLLELDLVRVKGRSLPERIYTVLGPPGMAADASCHALIDVLKGFHAAYRAQAWDRAEAALDAAAGPAEPFGLGGYLDVMRERIAEYRQAPPGPDWDGVHAATSK